MYCCVNLCFGCFICIILLPSGVINVETMINRYYSSRVFRLDALALSVIATATWLGGWVAGWVAGCHTPVLYQND